MLPTTKDAANVRMRRVSLEEAREHVDQLCLLMKKSNNHICCLRTRCPTCGKKVNATCMCSYVHDLYLSRRRTLNKSMARKDEEYRAKEQAADTLQHQLRREALSCVRKNKN